MAGCQGDGSPLLPGDRGHAVVATPQGMISRAEFLAHVHGVAALLPDTRYVVNLCEDRYRFLVSFAAAVATGKTSLLPASRARAAVDAVRRQHPDNCCVEDGLVDWYGSSGTFSDLAGLIHLPKVLPQRQGDMPWVEDASVVAIGYTSGSTGAPKPNAKTWGSFRTSTAQNLHGLAGLWPEGELLHVIATVPSQHMYGMELSVLLPLLGKVAVHAGRPFFPQDIAATLQQVDGHRLLVTTPVHLRALVESGIRLPPLAGIVTATAPLDRTLAAAAEVRFGCELREMFGSTETCVFATRRTAVDAFWSPYPGVSLQPRPDGSLVTAPHLARPMPLADVIELAADGRFRIRGRHADMVEIAGKRASLGELTQRLLAIPGVRDGVMLQLDDDPRGVRRIAALVAADGLDEAALLAALRESIDPVFLPRRVRFLPELPRNETGKLPRDVLIGLLRGD